MVTLEICDLDQTVSMSTIKDGLRPSRFFFSMKKKFSADYVKLLTRAEKYAKAEEAMVAKRDAPTNQAKRENKRRRSHLTEID